MTKTKALVYKVEVPSPRPWGVMVTGKRGPHRRFTTHAEAIGHAVWVVTGYRNQETR